MPVPIEARCRHCGRDLYLTELIRRRSGKCPRCDWPLSPDYPELLLEESERAERSLRELVRALRRLVGLPGNLDVKPHSLFRSLFEEVGWEQDLVAEPDLLAEEVERLKEQAERWGRLLSDPDESSSVIHSLRSLARKLRISADAEALSGSGDASGALEAAQHLQSAADAMAAGAASKSDVDEAVRVAGELMERSGAASRPSSSSAPP